MNLSAKRLAAVTLVFAATLFSSNWVFAGGRLLSVDDVLSIKVVGQPDLDTTARVETDGTVNFPYAGRVRAVGRSQDDLSRILADRLRSTDVVKDPHVLVELSSFGAQATVQGAVNQPQALALDRSATLTQILSRAGGLKETAGDVILRRRTKQGVVIRKFNAHDIETGVVDVSKVNIYNNDEIYVDEAPFFYLYGYVNKAGQYPLLRKVTVQQAISIGGGVAPLGSDWRIEIKRAQPDGSQQNVPASLDDVVQPNDTIVVNERIF